MLRQVVAENGPLFHHLTNQWLFEDGPKNNTCWTTCQISYHFKSVVHQTVAESVFAKVHSTMITAFERRCNEVYGRNQKDVVH
jgi:ribosome-associated toxin RatA of RatAB toxin-antitoxin module